MNSLDSQIEKPIVPPLLKTCSTCLRCFAANRINTHEAICQNLLGTKRKGFNMSKQRTREIELENFSQGNTRYLGNTEQKATSPLLTNWRKRHDEVILKIQKLKGEKVERAKKYKQLPLSPPVECDDSVQCPHCMRRFNEPASARHIMICHKI